MRTDYEEATALCLKVDMRGCKELREATWIEWWNKGLTAASPGRLQYLSYFL